MRITARLFKSPRQNQNCRPLAPALFDCPLPGDGFVRQDFWRHRAACRFRADESQEGTHALTGNFAVEFTKLRQKTSGTFWQFLGRAPSRLAPRDRQRIL
jgi:hypothetical protein